MFFDGKRRGFVDALGTEGLQQEHRGPVDNALYRNEDDDTADWLRRPLPST